MGEMDEEELLEGHTSKLECDHQRGKERILRLQRFKMKVR
jgi:hypothetical protein